MGAERKPRAVFFGTPAFAVPCLTALCDVAQVALVITQPDRPAGRGMKLTPPPVKQRALELGLPVEQPRGVKRPAFAERLAACDADVAVVVAYGRILPPAVLAAPRLGCVNVHASLLPELRGAAPIQWAIVRGHRESGVCLMQMDEGMDTGAVLACRKLAIGPDETAGELAERLSALGAQLLREQLPRFVAGELVATPQEDARASYAPLLHKSDGRIDWSHSAQQVHDLTRGLSPWPGAFSQLEGARVKVLRTRVVGTADAGQKPPGTITALGEDGIQVATGRGVVAVLELQLEGKRRMTAAQFIAGQRLHAGQRFGDAA